MQIRFAVKMTCEAYISQEAWRWATIEQCPVHGERECGIRSHGSYERKSPSGLRIRRFYCRKGQVTISLLPDFAAARFTGTLDELETAVEKAESAPSLAAAAAALRPELHDARSAARWLRRRVRAVQIALTALVTSLPQLAQATPHLSAVRAKLGTEGSALLPELRELAATLLPSLVPPLGFFRRARGRLSGKPLLQHEVGPDP
jgi:hypothetical protein